MANLFYLFTGPPGTFEKSTAEDAILAEFGEIVTPSINLAGSNMVVEITETVTADALNAVIRSTFGDIDYAEGQEDATEEVSVGIKTYYFGTGWFDDEGIHIVSGASIFAAGDAVEINDMGIIRAGLTYFDRYNADYAGISRRFEQGTFLPTGSSTPAFYIWFGDPTENTNLQTGGDFEDGALTYWTAADSGAPAWSADTAGPYAGTYAALLTTTDDADGTELQTNGDFETGDFTGWVSAGTATRAVTNTPVLIAGSYNYVITATANQTSTLTTDLGTPDRMAATAGLYYRFVGQCYGNPSYWSTFRVEIKWYTLTTGGALVSTSTLDVTPATSGDGHVGLTALCPPTATAAEIVITCSRNATVGTAVAAWDSISFKAAQYGTLTTNLGGTPRMAVTAGNTYQLSSYAKTDISGSGVWKLVQAEIKWYTATSGGSLVSTDVMPITLGTSYSNTAIPFTCPPTAAGAEIVITAVRNSTASYDSTVLAYFDEISLRLLTVSRYIKFLPNVTIEGGPLDLAELGSAPSTPASGYLSNYASSEDKPRVIQDTGQDSEYWRGENADSITATNTAATQTLITRTLKANAIGAKGVLRIRAKVKFLNNSGASRALTFVYTFGSYTFTYTTTNVANGATNIRDYALEIVTYMNQATNAQGHVYRVTSSATQADETAMANVVENLGAHGASAVDTTADLTVSLTVAMPTNTATQTLTGVASMDGPYFNS